MKTIIKDKVIEILDKIPLAENLARKKFVADFLLGLIESRKVQFKEVALHFVGDAKTESAERRIQSFFKDFTFDMNKVCALLSMFLPKGKVALSIDRTEWDFGQYRCNILMVVAYRGGSGIPLYWELLDNNSGNSSSDDRIGLLGKIIGVLGKGRIASVVGDREFIGLKWVKYLKSNRISYCMRVPKHHLVTLRNGDSCSVEGLLAAKTERWYCGCMVDGVICNAMMKKLPDGDFLYLIGDIYPKKLGAAYRFRWCVEVVFQHFKSRGFDLESTRLQDSGKLSKLLVFVSLAVAVCLSVGNVKLGKRKKQKLKNHGYPANSLFRQGLDFVRSVLKKADKKSTEIFLGYIESLLKWISLQVANNQYIAKSIEGS